MCHKDITRGSRRVAYGVGGVMWVVISFYGVSVRALQGFRFCFFRALWMWSSGFPELAGGLGAIFDGRSVEKRTCVGLTSKPALAYNPESSTRLDSLRSTASRGHDEGPHHTASDTIPSESLHS